MNNELHELLYYYNEEGYEGYDLSEVQLLGKIEGERVEQLKQLLHHEDRYIAYQAMLILLAWSVPEGFALLDRFIAEKWDEKESFEPHRIYDEDQVYDVITNALYISTFNGKNEQELFPYIIQFLNRYGDHFFESNLKNFLLKKDCRPLLKEIEQAMQTALQHERYYQASQLFPVLVHYDKNTWSKYRDVFQPLISQDRRIAYNMEEAEKKSINQRRPMYTDLEDRLTKKHYREIVEKALAQAKEEYEQFPGNPMNISFYNQLVDIKKTVIEDHRVYTEDEAYQKYPMAIMVVRNFLGEEANSAYANWLTSIVWGISLYPAMMEDIEIIKQKLFDGDKEEGLQKVLEIENQKIKLSDFYNNPLRELKKEIGDKSFDTVIKESKFNLINSIIERYTSANGLEMYYLNKNKAIYLFSYGEYQPGRYMLFLEGICHY